MPKYQFRVDVKPQFLPEQSDPSASLYMFAYTITITNTGSLAAHFFVQALGVVDVPGAGDQLRGQFTGVGDGDGVGKHVQGRTGVGLLGQKLWFDVNAKLVFGHGVCSLKGK